MTYIEQPRSQAAGGGALSADEQARALAAARRVADRFIERPTIAADAGYVFDLAMEGLAVLYEVTDERRYRDAVLSEVQRRGWSATQHPAAGQPPFTLLLLDAFARLGSSPAFGPAFVEATEHYRRTIARDRQGRMLHRNVWRNCHCMLIDSLQEYARRMAAAGGLCDDAPLAALLLDECVTQFELHRDAVRDPHTGLWSQGVGWDADDQVSPGAWSRGNGWVLRGMVECLRTMPRQSQPFAVVQQMATQLATDVCRVQGERGLWHALLHLPRDRSAVEASGSGMLTYALGRGVGEGMLPSRFAAAAAQGIRALTACVRDDGVVEHACPGPGPLRHEHMAKYLDVPGFKPDDPHGPGAAMLGLSAAAWLA